MQGEKFEAMKKGFHSESMKNVLRWTSALARYLFFSFIAWAKICFSPICAERTFNDDVSELVCHQNVICFFANIGRENCRRFFSGFLKATAATKFDPRLIFFSTRFCFCLKMCRKIFCDFLSVSNDILPELKKVTVDNCTSFPCKL